MTDQSLICRLAQSTDYKELLALELRAVCELNLGCYPQDLVEKAARELVMITPALIAEGHFFVLADVSGRIVACGGWSQQTPGYAADLEGAHADIAPDTGVVRSMFVLPEMARRGLGRRMMHLIEDDAQRHGVTRLTLSATRMGEPLYLACGYVPGKPDIFTLSDGRQIEGREMEKHLRAENVAGAAA